MTDIKVSPSTKRIQMDCYLFLQKFTKNKDRVGDKRIFSCLFYYSYPFFSYVKKQDQEPSLYFVECPLYRQVWKTTDTKKKEQLRGLTECRPYPFVYYFKS